MAKGVNTAKSNAQRVRVGDYGSQIVIELTNSEGKQVQNLEWVRVYPSNQPNITQFIDIPDFDVVEGNVYITLPDIPMGQYNIELKDDVGRIYPAEGSIRLNMVQSTKEAVEVYYVNYKDLILDDVTPIIEDYLVSNSDVFRGEKGDAFTWGDLTEEQKQELKGSDGVNGVNGLSAYELASKNGFDGSETEWLDSLKGRDGKDGERGSDGLNGSDGKDFTYEDFTEEQLENLKLKIVETEFDEDGNTIVSLTDGSSFTVNKGSQGVQGERGLQGEQGVQGLKGDKGDRGDTGLQGERGEQGEQGIQGIKGDKGEDGYTPIKGVDYFDGKDGKDGTDGLSFDYESLTEEQKAEIKGEKGDRGLKGDKGEDGYTPVKGVDYFDGAKGDKGDALTWDDLTQTQRNSLKGEKGDKGDTGARGEQGDKGEDGADGKDGVASPVEIYTLNEYNSIPNKNPNVLYFIKGE